MLATLLLLPQDLFGGDGAAFAAAAAAGLNSADESLPYSTSELNAPEYSTDDFRMFQFKVRLRRGSGRAIWWQPNRRERGAGGRHAAAAAN
jgi:hypothetical protein